MLIYQTSETMKKQLMVAIACAWAFGNYSFGQSSRYHWGLGIQPSTTSFYALKSGSNFFKGEDYGGGVAISMYRYLNPSFDMGLETGFGLVRHPLDAEATRPSQRDNFFHAQLGIKYKLDNGYILPKDFVVSPFIRAGFGTNTYKEFQTWYMHVPVGLGVMVRIPKTQINVVGQTGFSIGINSESFLQHSAGLVVNLGARTPKRKNLLEPKDPKEEPNNDLASNKPSDRDYDGVPDEVDRCPDIHGTTLTSGCPDQDGDGVPDGEDKCIDVKGFANLLGCADTDHDGIIDPDDQCADVYGVAPTGCPVADENDLDGDGVPNNIDECPEVKGLFTAKGCPDQDGDGIKDEADECPDYFGVAEHNGCPLPKAELERMRKLYDNQQLAKKYDIKDARNPYNPKSDKFDPTDPFNPFNPKNPNFNVNDPENPYNPDNALFDINDPHNPYNPKSVNYNPKYDKIKPFDPESRNPNPSDLDPQDPKNFGRIVIGTPTSDKFGGYKKPRKSNTGGTSNDGNYTNTNSGRGSNKGGNDLQFDPNFTYTHTPDALTGFTEKPTLTKEEAEYCERLDLNDLRAAIYFQTNNAAANQNSLKSLDKIVDAMRRCALIEIQIAGHADADGSDIHNQTLSERRAQAVLRYISGQGISDKRLKYNAYGEKYPAADNGTPEGKQQNRRTEIKVQKTY